MARDATAGARNEEGDGYRAALVNYRALAHALWTTREAVALIEAASGGVEGTSTPGSTSR